MANRDKLIVIRAAEEIQEHGSIKAAIAAVESQLQIPAGEYPPEFFRHMRAVLRVLRTQELSA